MKTLKVIKYPLDISYFNKSYKLITNVKHNLHCERKNEKIVFNSNPRPFYYSIWNITSIN
jgi:hypothetical protein